MKLRGRETLSPALTYIDSPATDHCNCLPLSALHKSAWREQAHLDAESVGQLLQVIPATLEMNSYLRIILNEHFPRSTPLSIMLLHISQLEHIHIAPKSAILHKRNRYHAPANLLEQILVYVRRTIRSSDRILVHAGTGVAMILPDVDQEGAQNILERVYYSINLLQPETVIPPLKRETDIIIGIGSYPKPGITAEDLLYYTGFIAHRLTLRPAVTTQLRGARPAYLSEVILHYHDHDDENHHLVTARGRGIPFMQLPTRLPPRLKHLIPYNLALELRCAPVGRDHNRLTVAMAHPTDSHAIDRLREATCMSIFPVAYEVKALDALLIHGW